jgi:hypothetical protein
MSSEARYLSLRDLAYWQSRPTNKSTIGPGRRWAICNAQATGGGCASNNVGTRRQWLAAPVIPWGADASGDVLRKYTRCTACGNRGATMQHPTWGGNTVVFLPFPSTLPTHSPPGG